MCMCVHVLCMCVHELMHVSAAGDALYVPSVQGMAFKAQNGESV